MLRSLAFGTAILVAACSTDAFAPPDAATDSGFADAHVEASLDGGLDAATGCAAVVGAFFCDDFERTSVQGTWASVDTAGSGGLSLVSGWSGAALHAIADGTASHATLVRTVDSIASYTFRTDLDVIAAAAGSIAVELASPSETLRIEVDGAVARLRIGASAPTPLGPFGGRHRIELSRDVPGAVVRATIDGKLLASAPLTAPLAGALVVRVGVVDPGLASVATELRFDDVSVAP